jgi:hypothetical protein
VKFPVFRQLPEFYGHFWAYKSRPSTPLESFHSPNLQLIHPTPNPKWTNQLVSSPLTHANLPSILLFLISCEKLLQVRRNLQLQWKWKWVPHGRNKSTQKAFSGQCSCQAGQCACQGCPKNGQQKWRPNEQRGLMENEEVWGMASRNPMMIFWR